MKPDLSHEIEVTPAFFDIDVMEIVWHGHYVKYLEMARSALLAKYGYDYPQMRASGYAWRVRRCSPNTTTTTRACASPGMPGPSSTCGSST